MRIAAPASILAFAAFATSAHASFHLMQIEQIIGGVGGDTIQQAIQLRMRGAGQNFVNNCVIRVFDAQGQNPITILTCNHNVAVGTGGSRILIASPNFSSATTPAATPDFVMTNLIPASYLAAGRMTWENGGVIYWSVAWGGAGYTGLNTGTFSNDADGNFGPAFAGQLPSGTAQAVFFTGAFSAASTTNAAQYAVTAGPATFVNDAGASFVVNQPPPPCPQDFNDDGVVDPDDLGDFINCYFAIPPCDGADFNADSSVDPDDLGDFINAYFGPAC